MPVTSRGAALGRDRASEDLPRGTPVQRLRVALLSLVAWLTRRLPERFLLRLADLAGEVRYRRSPTAARRARRNLLRVCEHLAATGRASHEVEQAASDPRALERIVRSAFRHHARYYLEVLRLPGLTSRTLRERVLIETPEIVEAAFSGDGPMIFVGLHFGAIELPALYLAERTGRPTTGPMERLADPELQRYMIRTRGAVNVRIVTLRDARRELLAALRRGEPVGLVGDRDITGGGLEVSLFGFPAPLPIGPALLAFEAGAPVYVVGVRREGIGRYRAQLRHVPMPAEGRRRERLSAALAGLAAAFEETIAAAPDQWWAVFFPIWPDLDPPEGRPAG